MRQYRTEKKEINEIDKIICNKCGKEIKVIRGVAQEDYLTVEKRWGYFSEKDNDVHRFELCEACYDEIVSQFQIPVEIE